MCLLQMLSNSSLFEAMVLFFELQPQKIATLGRGFCYCFEKNVCRQITEYQRVFHCAGFTIVSFWLNALISQWLLVWPTYPGKILRCYFLFVFQFQVFIRLFQCRWNTSLTRSYFTLFMRWFIAQSFYRPLINILFSCYITYV